MWVSKKSKWVDECLSEHRCTLMPKDKASYNEQEVAVRVK
uniref:Transposase n=1 Tax=Echinococcus granulosus TaxID=6210 RepID=A0A068X4X1_ECHGR|nr:hypothetical protein EgrG_000710100 [Echinococcus granulosus]